MIFLRADVSEGERFPKSSLLCRGRLLEQEREVGEYLVVNVPIPWWKEFLTYDRDGKTIGWHRPTFVACRWGEEKRAWWFWTPLRSAVFVS